jgi:hypothetical protein
VVIVNGVIRLHLLSDVEEIARAPRRTITFWIEQGVLLPEPGTNRAGRGVHRQFSSDEVVIACILRSMSQDHVVPIGRLLLISKELRQQLKGAAVRETINRAISGEVKLFLTLEPGMISEISEDKTTRLSRFNFLPDPTPEDIFSLTISRLIEDYSLQNCSKTIVYLNPWFSMVRETLK